jgi:hypothetical protein
LGYESAGGEFPITKKAGLRAQASSCDGIGSRRQLRAVSESGSAR